MAFFGSLPGNPLTASGLQQRQTRYGQAERQSFWASLPGNPLTASGLQQRQTNAAANGNYAANPAAPIAASNANWYWNTYLGNGSAAASSQPQAADYLDAPWASAYGMSKETAYSEAMENTAYRRSVADMQAAGLNPATIFGAGKGFTAGSPSYVSSPSSGGSGGRSGSSGSGKKSGYLLSGSAYSIMSALGGIVGAAATKSAGGYWIGSSLAQGAMHAASALSSWLRK